MTWAPLRNFTVFGTPGSLTVELAGEEYDLIQANTSATLRFVYERPYSWLDHEGDNTWCPIEWLKARVCQELYAELLPSTMKPDREEIQNNLAFYAAEAERAANIVGPVRRSPPVLVTPRLTF